MSRNTRAAGVCLVVGVAVLAAACQRSEPRPSSRQYPLRLEVPAGAATEAPAEPAKPTSGKQAAPSSQPAKGAAAKPRAARPVPEATRTSPPETQAILLTDANLEKAEIGSRDRDDGRRNEDEPILTTISGCLERHKADRFRLTDMIGEHAPKSRSWKTGFFRKGSAKLDLIDETSRLRLASHVGYRVDVTGALSKKVMRARAMTPTSARCS